MTKKDCPLGEDCDLTLAWMKGAEDARDKAKARIEALQQDRDEALNQFDSARHSVDVLEKRVEFVEEERRKTFQALLRVTKIHDEVEVKLAKAVDALQSVINACDQGRMIPRPGHGAGGMTIEANVKGSIYTGVPAWPIEEARTALAELKGDKP